MRWATPIIPLWCLYAGLGMAWVGQWLGRDTRSRAVPLALCGLLATPGALQSVLFDLGAMRSSRSYIDIHHKVDSLIPRGATLLKIVYGRFKLRKYEDTIQNHVVPNTQGEFDLPIHRRNRQREWEDFRHGLASIPDGTIRSFYFRELLGIAYPYSSVPKRLPPSTRVSFRQTVSGWDYLLVADDALERAKLFVFEETTEEIRRELSTNWLPLAEWELTGSDWGFSFVGKSPGDTAVSGQ